MTGWMSRVMAEEATRGNMKGVSIIGAMLLVGTIGIVPILVILGVIGAVTVALGVIFLNVVLGAILGVATYFLTRGVDVPPEWKVIAPIGVFLGTTILLGYADISLLWANTMGQSDPVSTSLSGTVLAIIFLICIGTILAYLEMRE